jgi:hypothetical protein
MLLKIVSPFEGRSVPPQGDRQCAPPPTQRPVPHRGRVGRFCELREEPTRSAASLDGSLALREHRTGVSSALSAKNHPVSVCALASTTP